MIDLSIIIVNYNTKEMLKECLNGVKDTTNKLKKEIIIVDNTSSDGSANMIKDCFPEEIIVENKKNVGFSQASNQGINIAKGKYILLINPDISIAKDTIEKTISFMEQNSVCGILGCRLIDKDGKLQPSARYFPTPWRLFLSYSGIGDKFPNIPFLRGVDNMRWDHNSVREVDWVPGCYFLIRKEVINEIGFFDRDYYLYYEEIDFCLRAKRNGWKIFFYPAEVIHFGGESAKRFGQITPLGKQLERFKLQSEFIYFRKNYDIFYTLLDFFFILLLDINRLSKNIISKEKEIKLPDIAGHIKLAYKVFLSTKFGLISND